MNLGPSLIDTLGMVTEQLKAISQFLENAESQIYDFLFPTKQTGKEIFKTCGVMGQGDRVELSYGTQKLTLFSWNQLHQNALADN